MDASASRAPAVERAVIRELSILDILMLAYLVGLLFAAIQGQGPYRNGCIVAVTLVIAAEAVMLAWARSRPGSAAIAWVYRLGTYATFQVSYFALRWLLPTASPRSVDPELLALDYRLFGLEPTLYLDRFVTPATTEWFAFFYFGYFALVAAHLFGFLFGSRRPLMLAEFMLAIFLVYCVGHIVYFLVPGYGPFRLLADVYQHPLPHGRWMGLVLQAVEGGGAQKDIFPSLHTAAPCVMALFSFRHRKELPFRYTWPFVAFAALNIVGATVFLRWHYLVDVVAGLALAVVSVHVAARIAAWEVPRRARLGLSPAWPELPETGRSRTKTAPAAD